MPIDEHFEYRYATLRDTERGSTGWRVRVRGDVGKLVEHTYTCPEHGRFVLRVPCGAVPDEMACSERRERVVDYQLEDGSFNRICYVERCGLTSPWAGASVAIGLQPGEVRG